MTSMVNKGIHKQKPRPSVAQLVTKVPRASRMSTGIKLTPQKFKAHSNSQMADFPSAGTKLQEVKETPAITLQDLSISAISGEITPLQMRSPERVIQHRPHYMCLSRRSRGESDDSYSSNTPTKMRSPNLLPGSTSSPQRQLQNNHSGNNLRISVSPISNGGNKNTSFSSPYSHLPNAPTTGRYNIMYFYQQLIAQINKAEKTTVVCSHLLKQLNWCLLPVSEAEQGKRGIINLNISSVTDRNAQTDAIKGFNDLLRAIQFAAEVDHPSEHKLDAADLMAPDQQAKCIIQYIKQIKNTLGIGHLFSLSDLLSHNSEILIQHLVSIYSSIIQEDPRIGPQRNYKVNREELVRLLSDLQPMMRASTPKQGGARHHSTEFVGDIDSLEAKKHQQQKDAYIEKCEEKIRNLKQMLDQQQFLPEFLNGGQEQINQELQKMRLKIATQQQTIQSYEGAVAQLTKKIKSQKQEFNDMLAKTQIVEQFAQSDKESYYDEIEALRGELEQARAGQGKQQPPPDNRQFITKITSLEKSLQEKEAQIKQLNEKLKSQLAAQPATQPAPTSGPPAPRPRGPVRPPAPAPVRAPVRPPAPVQTLSLAEQLKAQATKLNANAPPKEMTLAEQLAAQATKLNKNDAPEEKKVGSVGPPPPVARGPVRPPAPRPPSTGVRPAAPRPPVRPAAPVNAEGKPMTLAEQLAAQANKLNANAPPKEMTLAEQLAAQAQKLTKNEAPEEKKVGSVVEKVVDTEQVDKLNAENKGLKDKIAALEAEAKAQAEQFDKLKASEAAASKLSTSASEELSQLKALNESMVSEKAQFSLKHEESQKQLDKVKADLKQKSSEVMKAKLDAQAAAMQDKKKKEAEFKTQTTKIAMIETNITKLQTEKTALQKQFEEKIKNMVDAKAADTMKSDLEVAQKQLKEAQQASKSSADKLVDLEKSQKELTQKLKEKQQEFDDLKAKQVDPKQIESLTADKSKLETDNKALNDKVNTLAKDLEEQKSKLETDSKAYSDKVSTLEKDLESQKSTFETEAKKTTDALKDLQAAKDSEAKIKEELEKATASKGDLEKQIEELKKAGGDVDEIQTQLNKAEKQIEELQDDLDEAEDQMEQRDEDLAKAQQEVKDLHKQLSQIHELKTQIVHHTKDKEDAEAGQKQAENMVHQLTFAKRQLTTQLDEQLEEIEKLKNEIDHLKNASFVSRDSGNLLDMSGPRFSEKEGGPPISTLLNDSRLAGLDKSLEKTPDQSMEVPQEEIDQKSFAEEMKQQIVMESPSNNALTSVNEADPKEEEPSPVNSGFMGALLKKKTGLTEADLKAQKAQEQAMIDNASYDSEEDSDEESDEDDDSD